MKKYQIGIDGGGSRSKGVLVDNQYSKISDAEGLCLNPLTIGWKKFRDHLEKLLEELLTDASTDEVESLCAGLAGTGDEAVRKRAEKEIAALLPGAEVQVISDALAALWGAFRGGPGLLLIAGTGSICLGMDENGKIARSGGFGRILGDEGGGYWIALEAVKEALRGADGRGVGTEITDVIRNEFSLYNMQEIVPKTSSGELPPEKIAALTKTLLPLSSKDPTVFRIIKKAGKELADLVETTALKLNLKQPRFALWGGLWKSPGRELQAALELELESRPVACRLEDPAEPPEWGAVRYLQSLRR